MSRLHLDLLHHRQLLWVEEEEEEGGVLGLAKSNHHHLNSHHFWICYNRLILSFITVLKDKENRETVDSGAVLAGHV